MRSVVTALRARAARDEGSASLEFLLAGVLLLVPIVYLVLTLAQLEAATFAVVGASRQAARVFVESESVREGGVAAGRAIDLALADHGLDGSDVRVAIDCRPDPDDCLARQGTVRVQVAVEVPLPLIPPWLGAELPGQITVHADATEQVSRFRKSP